MSERKLEKINKEGDEVYCEVINKDLPGGNEGKGKGKGKMIPLQARCGQEGG